MMKASLTIFHGSQVDRSFSLMKDVLDKKAGSIRTETFSSIQTVKYHLGPETSVKYFKGQTSRHLLRRFKEHTRNTGPVKYHLESCNVHLMKIYLL